MVRVGNGSEGFDVSPDGKEIWVANAQDGTISIIDYRAKRVTHTLAPMSGRQPPEVHPRRQAGARLEFWVVRT